MRDESAAMAELSRNCMPAVELLYSKTMLTKILFTHTTKLNIAFKLTLPITPEGSKIIHIKHLKHKFTQQYIQLKTIKKNHSNIMWFVYLLRCVLWAYVIDKLKIEKIL